MSTPFCSPGPKAWRAPVNDRIVPTLIGLGVTRMSSNAFVVRPPVSDVSQRTGYLPTLGKTCVTLLFVDQDVSGTLSFSHAQRSLIARTGSSTLTTWSLNTNSVVVP